MIRNYFKTAIRNLRKNKVFTLITVFGLTIAMAVCIILSAHVIGEYSYDTFWDGSENIYRVSQSQYENGELLLESAKSANGLAYAMEMEFPEVKYATALRVDVITIYTPDAQIKDVKMYWTDTCVFKVFKFKAIYGSLENPFPNINSVVISKSVATKLYGDTDPVGKNFKLNEGWEFQVSAVFDDIPHNSHMNAECFFDSRSLWFYIRNFDNTTRQMSAELGPLPLNTRSGNFRQITAYTYVLLNKNASITAIEGKIPNIFEKYAPLLKESGIESRCTLQPISDIHLNSHLQNEIEANGDKDMIIALIIIAAIIICIAWINFINLALVRGMENYKSIGLHKIIGAHRKHILFQYLVENFLVNLVSLCIALLLVSSLRGWYFQVTGVQLNLMLHWHYYAYIALVILVGILISGLYPALILSSFKPIDLFSKLKPHGRLSVDLRKLLVVLQFAATIILIVGTITVFKQVNYMSNQPLGMNIDQTLVSFSPMSTIKMPGLIPKLVSFKEEIKKLPNVKNITTSSSIPGNGIEFSSNNVRRADFKTDINENTTSYYILNTDPDFINTYEIDLIAGSFYSNTEEPNTNYVVINEEALKKLGFLSAQDAIGKQLSVNDEIRTIKGVLKNYHHESLQKPIFPLLFNYSYRWNHEVGYYSFKIDSYNIQKTVAEIEAIWKRFYPQDHFDFFFLDEAFDNQYRQFKIFGKLFGAFSILAIIIACSGLLGLSAYAANRRRKEIGVRKVSGAKIHEILTLLNISFAKWVILSFIIACPIAWYTMRNWLENFAYKTTLSWWIFVLAGLLALAIALLTVSWHSWKAATSNPVESLRHE